MRLLALAVAALALPGAAQAETPTAESGITVSGSLTFASRYVSDGIEYSDGPVIQPYVELGFGGFYAGVWATNAEETLLGADSEIDIYLGYRGEAGAFYYDIGYGYYTFPGASDLNTGEVLVSGGAGLSEALFVTAYFAYSNEFDTLDRSLRVDFNAPIEGLALATTVGDNESWRYWSVGGSYALTETLKADLTWHGTDIDDLDGGLVGGLSVSF